MLLFLLAILAAPLPETPVREKASGFTFVRPKGWSRQDVKENNSVVLAPPGPAAQQCSVFIFLGQNGELNELVFHNNFFQAVTQGLQVEGNVDRAYRGSWQYSRARARNSQNQLSWLTVYTTKSDTRMEGILFAAGSEEMLKAQRFAVEKMITGIEFLGARPPPPGGPEWAPAPVPDKNRDIKILGAWVVARMETTFSADATAGGVRQEQTVKVIALFENKIAAKVDARQSGLLDSTYPAEGLATMNVSNAAALANDRRYGRWSEADGKIKIQWNQGPEDNVQRVKDDLKGGDVLWSALKSIDGMRLDGTYVREMPFGPPYTITFRQDGTFDADQVNETIGGKLVNKKFPEMGSGTYELRKWSLILRFDTGFVQSIHFELDSGGPAQVRRVLINGYPFEREGAPAATPLSDPGTTPASTSTPAAPSGGTVVQGLVIPLPPDWIRKDDPTGSVYLFPPQAQNSAGYFLLVLPSNRFEGTHWSAHKAVLKMGLGWSQIAEGAGIIHYPDGPGPFIRSDAVGKLPSGELRELQLFSAVHDGVLEAILTMNHVDINVVYPILMRTVFKDPPRPQALPRVVEAYRHVDRKSFINPNGAALLPGGIHYERIWLRADGTADFTAWYPEGYAASPSALKLDPGLEDGHSGSWKAVGNKIHIVRNSAFPVEVYDRENGAIRSGAKTWESMPRVDGLKLSGRWAAKSAPGAIVAPFHHWIDFTAEGRFKSEGLLSYVSALDLEGPKPPEKCDGTYEIRDWTIFCQLSSGGSWSTDISTIGRDPKDLSSILLRAYVLWKE